MKKYRIKILNPILGVPITFLDKYNPDQFEILGKTNSKLSAGEYLIGEDPTAMINGRKLYHRILIRKKEKENENNTKENKS